MNLKRILIFTYLTFLFLLNNCVSSGTAFFGPALTVAKTGNIMQGGLSYSSSALLKSQTGKGVSDVIESLVKKDQKTIIPVKTLVQPNNEKIVNSIIASKDKNEQDYNAFLDAVNKILK